MYKVIKEKGYSSSVSVINTDTHALVTIGGTTRNVMTILREAGIPEDTIDALSEWDITIDKETASRLVALAMGGISKPIRDQRKIKEDKPTGKVGVDIDAFDLIYGI